MHLTPRLSFSGFFVCAGKRHSINFPLNDGMEDESFMSIFRPTIRRIMERFNPGAVVLQCGADSLSGDRLGVFNLSLRGHADCVSFVKVRFVGSSRCTLSCCFSLVYLLTLVLALSQSFNVPVLVLGGGGYTMRNLLYHAPALMAFSF